MLKLQKSIVINDVEIARRLLRYVKPYRTRLIGALGAAALFGIVAAVPTYVLKHTIDDVFLRNNHHLILPFMGAFVLFFALKAVFMYLTAYFMHWISNRVVNDVRADVLSSIIHYPLSFFYQQSTGQLMSYFLNDVQMVQNAASTAIKNGVRSFFEAIFLIGFAFFQNWQLSLVMLLVGPFMALIIRTMGRIIKKSSLAIQREIGGISSFLQETFVGIRDIKACNGEEIEAIRFKKLLQNCFRSVMKFVQAEALLPGLIEVVAMFGGACVFYIACQQVLRGDITPGQLTAFVAALLLAYQPLKRVMNVYAEIQYGLAAAGRIFVLMDRAYPALLKRQAVCVSLREKISFNHVSCGYSTDKMVLNDVTLTVRRGERIGIIGPSGAGKSTLCDLLLGFMQPHTGTISFDDQDLQTLTLHSLRSQIGYVGQRCFLFNDTILHNVTYAHPEATMDEVVRACKAAHAHEFITQLEHGYHTDIGENGGRLSGGQRQRLTIARALLKNPSILVFDEATSSLDNEAEEVIKQAIYELPHDKTVVIVSHRPSILTLVDRLLVVDKGSLYEAATNQVQQYQEISNH